MRLHMTGGEVLEIEDADSVFFGRSTVEILLPRSDEGRTRSNLESPAYRLG
jgi:hypothetical protein